MINYKGKNISITMKGDNDEISKKNILILIFFRSNSNNEYYRISNWKIKFKFRKYE